MGKPQTQTSTQTSTLAPYQQGQWQNLIGQTNTQTNQDIGSVNYQGIQNQLGQNAQNILGNQVNAQGLAQPISQAGQNNWASPGTAQQFMSPYENTALANQVNLATQTELNPQLAAEQRSDAASGALGGSRGAINQSLTTQGFNQNMNNLIAQGENQAYNTGEQQFNTQNALNLQAQQAAAQTQLAGANSNVYANLAANQPLMQQIQASEAPEQQLATEAGILGQMPREGTTTGSQTVDSGGSGIGGVLGGLLGGAGQLFTGLGTAGIMGGKTGGLFDSKKGFTGINSGKRPSANVGIPFEQYSAGYNKGGKIKKSKKGGK